MAESPSSASEPPHPEQLDPEEIRLRLDRINQIFTGVASHAEEVSRLRCPYRDRLDRCTALFRCRNQRAEEADPEELFCGHDGAFDYRTAWETDARAYRRTKDKIASIKREAAQRRREAGGADSEAAE